MTVYSSAIRGDIETKDRYPAHKVVAQAVSTTLIAGSLVYQDGASGIKVAPVDATVFANRIFFCPEGQDSTATLGDKMCTLYKTGHIVIGKCGGAIVVDDYCRQGTTAGNAGEFETLATPTASGASYSQAEALTAQKQVGHRIAIYLGRAGEGAGTSNIPTDAVDGTLGRFYLL